MTLITLVICLVIGEFGLRAIGVGNRDVKPTDPRTGLRTFPPRSEIPYRSACFSNVIRTNSDGFHGREYAREKPAGVYRIVILGDSFVEAAQVDRDKAFPAVLEDLLNASSSGTRYEVIPVGMGGNGNYANLQYLAAYGISYHPDLVIDMYNINDTENDAGYADLPKMISSIVNGASSETSAAPVRPGDTSSITAFLKSSAKKSALVVTAYTAYLNAKARARAAEPPTGTAAIPLVGATMFLKNLTPEAADAWDRQETLFAAMRDVSQQRGAKFLLSSITADNRVNEVNYKETLPQLPPNAETDPYMMEKRLGEIAGRLGVTYLPTVEEFSKLRNASESAAWPCDGHYNEAGNRYLAQTLYDGLTQHPEFLTP